MPLHQAGAPSLGQRERPVVRQTSAKAKGGSSPARRGSSSFSQLTRADTSLKASLKGKCKYAGWDNAFIATLIAG